MFPDELDLRLLRELQKDSRRSVRQLAKSLKESPSTIYNRVKRLEERNVIKRWTIALDYSQLEINTTAFVLVEINGANGLNFDHREIATQIAKIEGVYEVHLISGEFDLLCKVRASTIEMIGDLVLNKIRNIRGVSKTMTNTVFRSVLQYGDITPAI